MVQLYWSKYLACIKFVKDDAVPNYMLILFSSAEDVVKVYCAVCIFDTC